MKILWAKILIAGFAFEILAVFLLVVVNAKWLKYPLTDVDIIIGLFIASVLGGLLIGKKTPSHQILHGALFGVVTILAYTLIAESAEIAGIYHNTYDIDYFLKHISKILGGALGGLIAFNLSKKDTTTEVKVID